MTKIYRPALVLACVAFLASAVYNVLLYRRHDASFHRTAAGNFLRIRGDGGVVILGGPVLREFFGDAWQSRALYYRCYQWASRGAKEHVMSEANLRPLCGSMPVLEIPREDAAPARILIYAPDEKRACFLDVDMTLDKLTPGECRSLPGRVDVGLPNGAIKW